MITNSLYKRAILSFFLIGVVALLPLFILHALALGLDLPEWLLVAIFGCVGPLVSGMGYKGKLLDKTANIIEANEFELSEIKPYCATASEAPSKTAGETVGLVIGFTAAVTVFILALVFHQVLPFGGAIGSFFGTVMLFVANASLFMGLCSRTGRVADYVRHAAQKENPFQQEKVNYVLAISVGVLIGTAIVVATIATGGTIGALAAIGCVSSCASASGYIGICADVFLGKRTIADVILGNKNDDTSTFWDRLKSPEAIGTLIGVGVGILIAVIVLSSGLTLPIIGGGVVAAVSIISAGGGLGNRLGHLVTKVTHALAEPAPKEEGYHADSEDLSEFEEKDESPYRPALEKAEKHEWTWEKKLSPSSFSENYRNIGSFRPSIGTSKRLDEEDLTPCHQSRPF